MTDSHENSGAQEHDVDAILASAYGGSENPSYESPNSHQPVAQAAPEQQAAPQYKEYEFNARGQAIKIKDNDPRLSQWLSQGYDYSQNINAFKQERALFEKTKSELEGQFSQYKEIDEFAKSNPDWWNTVEQSYKQREQRNDGVPAEFKQYLDQRLEPVAKDIPLMKQFLQEMQTQKMEKQQAEEDSRLGEAMKSIQAKYPNLDFNAKDESGQSLEHRILEHAVQNGFPTFRAAFLDYYHDSLEQQAEARGRESLKAEMNKRTKLGLLDDPAPGKAPTAFLPSRKAASWSDPMLSSDQILKEFNFR